MVELQPADRARRRFLQAGAGSLAFLSGCLGLGKTDPDGDGVPDQSDYAPSDPAVQERSDLRQDDQATQPDASGSDSQQESEPQISCGEADARTIENALRIEDVRYEYDCMLDSTHGDQMAIEVKNTGEINLAYISFTVTFRAEDGTGISSVNPFTGTPPSPGGTVVLETFPTPGGCDTAKDVKAAIKEQRYSITNIEDWNC